MIWRGPMVHKLLQQFIEDVRVGGARLSDRRPAAGHGRRAALALAADSGDRRRDGDDAAGGLDHRRREGARSMWKRVEVPVLGLIENMSGFVCPSCGHHEEIFLRGGGRKLAEREHIPFLGEIPLQVAVSRGGDDGMPVTLSRPRSRRSPRRSSSIAETVACRLSVTQHPRAQQRQAQLQARPDRLTRPRRIARGRSPTTNRPPQIARHRSWACIRSRIACAITVHV